MLPIHIQRAIDEYFEYLQKKGLNWIPTQVPSDMGTGQIDDEFAQWIPVQGTATKEELTEFGTRIGTKLSPQYCEILGYQHFMELEIGDLSFFPNPSTAWQEAIYGLIFNGHPRRFLVDKRQVPFARWGDWGLYCFNTNKISISGEYPICQWDHDEPGVFYPVGGSLYEVLSTLIAKSA